MSSILYKQQLQQLSNNFKLLFKGYLKYIAVPEDPIEYSWALFKGYCRIKQDSYNKIILNNVISEFNNYSDKYVNEFIYVVFEVNYFKRLCLEDSLLEFNKLFHITKENTINTDIIHQSSFFNENLLTEWRIWYLYGKILGIEMYNDNINKLWENFNNFWEIKHYHHLHTSLSLKMYYYLNSIKQFEFEIENDSLLIKNHYYSFLSQRLRDYSLKYNYYQNIPIIIQESLIREYIKINKKSTNKILKKQKIM